MLISVIIPVYNVEKTLERAVQSVLDQTYTDLEILLVNDGSTDGSGALCDQLAQRDARIKVIHKPNGGLSSARNAGMDQAAGDFFAFLDSDDYFERDILESFADQLREHPDLDLYLFNVIRVKDEQQDLQAATDSVSWDAVHNMALLFDYPGLNFYAWNKVYRRSLFDGVRYPEGKLYEDTMPSYWTMQRAAKVIATAKPGIYYIQNPDSIVASSFNPKQYDNVTERIRLYEEIQKDYPTLSGKALARLLDGFLSTGYKIASSKETTDTEVFYGKLKTDIAHYKKALTSHSEVPKIKLLALRLLLLNRPLYRRLYKLYLGK